MLSQIPLLANKWRQSLNPKPIFLDKAQKSEKDGEEAQALSLANPRVKGKRLSTDSSKYELHILFIQTCVDIPKTMHQLFVTYLSITLYDK